FLEQVVVIPKPVSALFVEAAIYDYLRWVDYASVLWNTGEHEAACEIAEKVLHPARRRTTIYRYCARSSRRWPRARSRGRRYESSSVHQSVSWQGEYRTHPALR